MICPDCKPNGAQNGVADGLVAGGVAKGAAAPMIIRERRSLCKGCEHADISRPDLVSWANFSTCLLCRCNIAQKTRLAASLCPDVPARWGAVQVG